jgi:signal transduction histidine kinase
VAQEGEKLRRLLDVGRSFVAELDPDAVLDRILEEARAATGAQFAAIGILNEERTALARFLTSGIDSATHRAIGNLPLGRGVLGELIDRPQPLRLREVGAHPHSWGFPANHPVMHSFVGVPVVIRGRAWGNLYLAEKEGGQDFTDDDEETAVILADWAATAIENARLYQSSEQRRQELERAVLGLEAARDIADAIGGATELDRILELVVKRGRALVDARTVLIMLRNGDDLVVAASAGHAIEALGRRLPVAESTAGAVLERGQPMRVTDVTTSLRISPKDLGVPGAHTALLVPMIYRGSSVGVLAAFDRGAVGEPFSSADEQLLRTFAASGANAVAISRSVEADRLRSAIAAADQERGRWARELHDQTLQALGALRVLLASALRQHQPEGNEEAMRQAIADIELEIESLRAIISDLRPSLLDDLGLQPAIDALLDRRREDGLEIEITMSEGKELTLPKALETTVYRLLQESLANVVKHAHANRVDIRLDTGDQDLTIEVRDDGTGFDPAQPSSGFGLAGMRERIFLAGGRLEINSDGSGTHVSAQIPLSRASDRSRADQLAS